MDNYLLMKKSVSLEKLSKALGFSKAYFLEDFDLIESVGKKEILKKINKSKKKVIVRVSSEELLRFVLEKTSAFGVVGMESINYKDSMHYVRSGMDQIDCKIAKAKGKVVVFSFSDVLNSVNRGRLLARMQLNFKLCKKYGVKVLLSNFSKSEGEMRSAKDLEAFMRVLGKFNKKI